MTVLEEVLAAGALALGLPTALWPRRPGVRQDAAVRGDRHPVLMVHGFGGTDAVWDPLGRALRASGFGHVARLSYNSFFTDVGEIVRAVHDHAATAMAATGAEGVHLIGHSLGGLLLRYAVDCATSRLSPSTVVTIATPHRGAPLARWAPGPCARLMHPGSPGTGPLHRGNRPVRWVSLFSDGDWVVPPSSARLPASAFAATNVHIPNRGHLTICRDPGLIARVVAELLRSEGRAVEDVA